MMFGLSVNIRVNPWRKCLHRTSKLTVVPATTFCPAPGTCDTITLEGEGCAGSTDGAAGFPRFDVSPATELTGNATLTFPNRNPASCKLRLALPSDWPTKLGITNACGSAATVTSKLIFGADTCASFAVGLCAST